MIELPRLRNDQVSIARHPARIKVAICGRRFGKTLFAYTVCTVSAVNSMRVAWIVPEYNNASSIFRNAQRDLNLALRKKVARIHKTDKRITFKGRGSIQILTASNPDQMRNEHFDLIVVDEASLISDDVYYAVISPMRADYNAPLIAITTPRGRQSWVYNTYKKGLDHHEPDYMAWHYPTHANPMPGIQEWLKDMKNELPQRTWQREILAEFDDGGSVFGNLTKCLNAKPKTPADVKGRTLVAGVDWGQEKDFTAISIIDTSTMEEVFADRFNHISYDYQLDRLINIFKEWSVTIANIEKNSMGLALLNFLYRANLETSIVGFTTTNESKRRIIEGLSFAFEREECQFLSIRAWTEELESFEMTVSNSGTIRYGSPKGDSKHDDTVIARALAYDIATRSVSNVFV